MLGLDDRDVSERLALDNPWWTRPGAEAEGAVLPRRAAFEGLMRRLDKPGALVLAGPRRVGKTVLARQAMARLLDTGLSPRAVAYADLSCPILRGRSLDRVVAALREGAPEGRGLVVLDRVHYRPGWEAELADAAARRPSLTLLGVTALRPDGPALVLPPLSFRDYLRLTGAEAELIEPMFFGRNAMYVVRDMAELDRRFVHYVNSGGFPEAVLLRPAHGDAVHHLRAEVTDALLHNDLGEGSAIGDSAELAALFALLARNTAREVSVEAIADATRLAKNTVRRYLEFLEAASLIIRLPRLHPEGARFRRMRTFKVHLTAPCLYAALFGPVAGNDPRFAALAESAAVAQWLGTREMERLHFARLPEGPVDLVALDGETGRPAWACALAGTDASAADEGAMAGLVRFAQLNAPLRWVGATTRALAALKVHGGIEVWHRPAAQYTYEVGRRADEDSWETS